MRLTYRIEGMHCTSCIEKIKSSLTPRFKITQISLKPPMLQIEASKPPPINELNIQISLAGNYRLQPIADPTAANPPRHATKTSTNRLWDYYPIFLITGYIFGISFINNIHGKSIIWQDIMNQFMAGFFLVFSAFKFLDIHGFSEGYATYDLLAKRWKIYGYIYPFFELGLGLLYTTKYLPFVTYLLTIVIMGFSSLGVINSLLKKQKLHCVCLGTKLNVPLSSITLIEDLTMVILAALALAMR